MNLFIYSDESGVFDKVHNDIFVFGGTLFLGKEQRDIASRKYSAAERIVRKSESIDIGKEVKAFTVSNGGKYDLYRSLNKFQKFGVVVDQQQVLDRIYKGKKDKQRYLDYVYKIGIKRKFECMIKSKTINPDEIEGLYFFIDEHTTATNGCYELKESLEQEFKFGTYNYNYCKFYPPIFPNLKSVNVTFCNSSSKLLIRSADIVANRIFYLYRTGQIDKIDKNTTHICFLPME